MNIIDCNNSAEANIILGDIPKVTPSSKVVGDLAQFMVAQDLDAHSILEQADTLAFPESVVQYLRGEIGIPPGGFPEPLRSKVLGSRGLDPINGRPGASLDDYDFESAAASLRSKYGESVISDKDVLSHALYPKVFEEWKIFERVFGDISGLPTNLFLNPMEIDDEVELEISHGRSFLVKLTSIQTTPSSDGTRQVTFTINGEQWFFNVVDENMSSETSAREKAGEPGTVGAPMPGVIVGLKVDVGDEVKEGDAVATLSAMKMETVIPATASGTIERIAVNVGEKVEGDDLIIVIS